MNKVRFREHLINEDLLKNLDKKGSINLIELLERFYNFGLKDAEQKTIMQSYINKITDEKKKNN